MWTDGRTNMMKQVVPFLNFAKAPEKKSNVSVQAMIA